MNLTLVRTTIPLNRTNDIALVLGDGRSAPQDMYTFLEWKLPHDVISIGRSINLYEAGPIQHWANVDGADSKWWSEHLPGKNHGRVPCRHTLGELDWYDCIWDDGMPDGSVWNGSSALFSVLIALQMGYRRVVMAGCPLDTEGHWYHNDDVKGPVWRGEDYRAWLDFSQEDEAVQVRSLSGYTAKIVGYADRRWATCR
jgi:hypothetical protein